ncbi:MAG: exonuclease SbcCD subunit D [Bacteroidales bacterium]|nr:exonuclease SbcCD subunit D [Bacteroidales bacterium]
MKILHTSDWHLGHSLYNYDRTEEQASMLEQMASIVGEQRPDVFLICGDVYHTPQPSAAVQTMLTEALMRLHDANPQMTIVMTAGNHDSGSKHEIFRLPWQALNVYAIGQLDRAHADSHIVKVDGKGFVVALPYSSERNIPEGFIQKLLDRVAELNSEGLPVVLSAHTTVSGCDYTGHDRATERNVGGIDSLSLEQLGEGYDYLALGHIHRQQFVHSGRHNVRYSGTPLPVSFDETFVHTVSIVGIDRHGDIPSVEQVEIHNPRPLVTLPTQGYASWEDAMRLLFGFPNDLAAYIRLNVETDDFLPPEANAEASAATEGKQCRFCVINSRRKRSVGDDPGAMTVEEFQSEEPKEIARRYAQYAGIEFNEEMESLFDMAIAELENE